MDNIFTVALEVQKFLNDNKWRFCIIGGIAVQRWGEPRVTRDVDLSLLTSFKNEELFIDILLDKFKPRIPDAKNFALQYRVLLLESSSKTGIDIALAGFPFEEAIVNRATPFEFLDHISLITCSAEDLIILKAFASRDKDWMDIKGIIQRNSSLNWNLIIDEVKILAEIKEDDSFLTQLLKLKE